MISATQGYFPVLITTGANSLAVVYRTGAAHYGLLGTLATSRSEDGGQSWSAAIEIAPRGLDVRNPAFGTSTTGAWLLAYWQASVNCYPLDAETGERTWNVPTEVASDDLFIVRSSDRGAHWTTPMPYRSKLLRWCSPFGRIVASADGTLLLAAYGPPRTSSDNKRFDSIIIRSHDDGRTWGEESLVSTNTSELALAYLKDELLVGVVRHADGHCVQVASADHGRTWNQPLAVTDAMQHPADICRLASGRVLLTFGRRQRPLGAGALISDDQGATWDRDREAMLASDGIGNDVGYPSTVQLADGTIVTAMYFAKGSETGSGIAGWGDVSCQALRYREDDLFPR